MSKRSEQFSLKKICRSFVFRELQIKIIIYYYTHIRIAEIQKTENINFCLGWKTTLINCCGGMQNGTNILVQDSFG